MAFTSCKKDVDPGGTAVQSLANEWYVQVQVVDLTPGAPTPAVNTKYYKMSTYNTADNQPNMIWFDDTNGYTQVKLKANADVAGLSFSATGATDVNGSTDKVTISNAKIVKDGAVGPSSKAVTDAISYDVKFSSDNNLITYKFKGYARTRFVGDDH
ncbi:hypothetical protein H7F33_19760 [Pedobacter sp. PAMC26386]|nr:hypothetical protein H7F33_19760 [Pedobacter sp. PAMC26386]